MFPSVQMLTVHLPGHQSVRYPPTKSGAEEALKKNQITPLIAYFIANQHPELYNDDGFNVRQVKYEDMPSECTWDQSNRC